MSDFHSSSGMGREGDKADGMITNAQERRCRAVKALLTVHQIDARDW
jgi:hypothetical protein